VSLRLTPEVSLFARTATFGLVAGTVYWLLTSEVAGTVLLEAFGVASLVAAIGVFFGQRRSTREAEGARAPSQPGSPAESTPPAPGWAPLLVALGLAGVALGLVLGPWLSIAGVLLAARSAKVWLDVAVDEWRGGDS
jgi:hypothetical protein